MVDTAFVSRQARRAAELEAVRSARAELKATTLQARSDAEAAMVAAAYKAEQEALDAKRQDRKLRKTARKVDADVRRQDRRDALQAYTRTAAE